MIVGTEKILEYGAPFLSAAMSSPAALPALIAILYTTRMVSQRRVAEVCGDDVITALILPFNHIIRKHNKYILGFRIGKHLKRSFPFINKVHSLVHRIIY